MVTVIRLTIRMTGRKRIVGPERVIKTEIFGFRKGQIEREREQATSLSVGIIIEKEIKTTGDILR